MDKEERLAELWDMRQKQMEESKHVVLYDGSCGLCNRSVWFIIERDSKGLFSFASQQSIAAQALQQLHSIPDDAGSEGSVIYLDNENFQVWTQSDASIRIGMKLGGIWILCGLLLLIPRFIRDAAYRCVARNRSKWFGESGQCRIPTAEDEHRFLHLGDPMPDTPAQTRPDA